MLRGLQTPYLAPIIQGYQINATGAAANTITINSPDLTSVSSSSSVHTATLKLKARRNRVVISTPVDTAGKYCTYNSLPTENVAAHIVRAGGSATTGKFNAISMGFNNPRTMRISPLQTVKALNGHPRIVAGYISSAGAILMGIQGIKTVTKSSSVYTITFRKSFGRTPVVVASGINTTSHAITTIHTEGKNEIKIATFDATGAASDRAFYFIAYGWDTPTTNYGMQRSIKLATIKPRIEAFLLTNGSPYTVTIGDGSVASNGTGDKTLTFAKPFKRAPIVVISGENIRASLVQAATTTGTRFLITQLADGTVADEGKVMLLALGWDNVTEL